MKTSSLVLLLLLVTGCSFGWIGEDEYTPDDTDSLQRGLVSRNACFNTEVLQGFLYRYNFLSGSPVHTLGFREKRRLSLYSGGDGGGGIVDAITNAYRSALSGSGIVYVDLRGYQRIDFGNLVFTSMPSEKHNKFREEFLKRANATFINVRPVGISVWYGNNGVWQDGPVVINRPDLMDAEIVFDMTQRSGRAGMAAAYGNIYLSHGVNVSIIADNYKRDTGNWPILSGVMLNISSIPGYADKRRWNIKYLSLENSVYGNAVFRGGHIQNMNNRGAALSTLDITDTEISCSYI